MSELVERTVPGLHQHLLGVLQTYNRASRVLDLGCGTGAWLKRLHDAGFHKLSGVDLEPQQFAFSDAEFMQLNLDKGGLSAIEGKYDLITAIEFIEHLGDIASLLSFVNSRLTPQGAFLLSTPNVNSLAARLRLAATGKLRHFDQHGDPTHISPIFLEPFSRLLESKGLAIEKVWTYPEHHSRYGAKRLSMWATSLLRLVLADPYPGDILCVMIRQKQPGR